MRIERISHATGGVTLVLMGLVHLVGHVISERVTHTAEEQALLDAMAKLKLGPPGSASFKDIFDGFSLSFSVFPILLGVVALLLLRRAGDRPEVLRPVRLALVAFLAIETAISLCWFIPPPTLFLAVATAAFLVSLLAMKKSAPRA